MVTIRVYDFLRRWRFVRFVRINGTPTREVRTRCLSKRVRQVAPTPRDIHTHPWVPIGCQWNINKANGDALVMRGAAHSRGTPGDCEYEPHDVTSPSPPVEITGNRCCSFYIVIKSSFFSLRFFRFFDCRVNASKIDSRKI